MLTELAISKLVHNLPRRPLRVGPDVRVASLRVLLHHRLDLLLIQQDVSLVLPGVLPYVALGCLLRVGAGEDHAAFCTFIKNIINSTTGMFGYLSNKNCVQL